MTRSFDCHGPEAPIHPVVLSVPHAGREYPLPLRAALAVPLSATLPLEDRLADRLALAARRDETLFIARRARAWIDLNRHEEERDPRVEDRRRSDAGTAKTRSGLGLVPRRATSADLWRRRFSADEIDARIAADHRPYHAALASALAAARKRFGVAVLLDIHSMPPLGRSSDSARIVFGDRFGSTAATRFLARAEARARAAGIRSVANIPYAGGYILARHGAPMRGIHAIQIEFDRTLYLDESLAEPGPGFTRTAALLRDLIDAIADEAIPGAIAAE